MAFNFNLIVKKKKQNNKKMSATENIRLTWPLISSLL